jgi:hypothetical protein
VRHAATSVDKGKLGSLGYFRVFAGRAIQVLMSCCDGLSRADVPLWGREAVDAARYDVAARDLILGFFPTCGTLAEVLLARGSAHFDFGLHAVARAWIDSLAVARA